MEDTNSYAFLQNKNARDPYNFFFYGNTVWKKLDRSWMARNEKGWGKSTTQKKGVMVTTVISKGFRWKLTGVAGGKETVFGVFELILATSRLMLWTILPFIWPSQTQGRVLLTRKIVSTL